MEVDERKRQAVVFLKSVENRDVLKEARRPRGRVRIVLSWPGSLLGTKFSVFKRNLVLVLVGEANLPMKFVEVLRVEFALED